MSVSLSQLWKQFIARTCSKYSIFKLSWCFYLGVFIHCSLITFRTCLLFVINGGYLFNYIYFLIALFWTPCLWLMERQGICKMSVCWFLLPVVIVETRPINTDALISWFCFSGIARINRALTLYIISWNHLTLITDMSEWINNFPLCLSPKTSSQTEWVGTSTFKQLCSTKTTGTQIQIGVWDIRLETYLI